MPGDAWERANLAASSAGVALRGLTTLEDAEQILSASLRVPGKASMALLLGVYALHPDAAERARRAGSIAALALTIASGFVAIALAIAFG